ncbi:hypothetical protein [Chamaesiphon sp.]|uniref:hypothetical protein n=1 Tax=Chamaesiphon sp. TaxID=2814140 RepID=UPI0035946872
MAMADLPGMGLVKQAIDNQHLYHEDKFSELKPLNPFIARIKGLEGVVIKI